MAGCFTIASTMTSYDAIKIGIRDPGAISFRCATWVNNINRDNKPSLPHLALAYKSSSAGATCNGTVEINRPLLASRERVHACYLVRVHRSSTRLWHSSCHTLWEWQRTPRSAVKTERLHVALGSVCADTNGCPGIPRFVLR